MFGKEMGEKLLDILNTLPGDRANEILFGMCDHPSDKVRRKAIKELLDRDPQYAQRLFSLIDDPDNEVIRTHILAAIAKQRSSAAENMLLGYLEKNSAQDDQDHILACYKALGRCGSNASVPFLRSTLLGRGWNSFMGTGRLVFREGAAIALALLDTPQARSVLLEASKSNFKVVREAFARSRTIIVSGENPND
jgi:HEAT repeat protein